MEAAVEEKLAFSYQLSVQARPSKAIAYPSEISALLLLRADG
jgi:hypothetical protein